MLKLTSYPWLQIGTILLLLYILQLTSSVQMAFSTADNETVVKIEPQYNYADVGEKFTINITVVNVQNLYGVEITLQWNASILKAVSVDLRLGINESHQDGVLYNPIFIAKNETQQTEGKYLLAATSCNPAPPYNGTGNIVRITFLVLTVGNCTLDLSSKLADWPPPDREPRIPYPIKHTTIDGYFTITIPEFPNNITVLVLIILSTALSYFSTKLRGYLQRNINNYLFYTPFSCLLCS